MSHFKGWSMVASAFMADFVAVGFFFYSYGVFFKALALEFEGSRFNVSLGLTLANMTAGLAAPLVGYALDKYSIKHIMSLGAAIAGISFLGLSLISQLWHLYLIAGVLTALGVSMLGGLATAKLVTNWFYQKRGLALGMAAMGISVSGVLMPPVATYLIEQWGWRFGFIVYGGFILAVILPSIALLVIGRPEQIGMVAYGSPIKTKLKLGAASDYRLHTLLRQPTFWWITACFAMIVSILSAVLTHLVPYLTDRGWLAIDAAFMLSICAAAGVLGKLCFGYAIDKWPPVHVVKWAIGFQFVGLCGLIVSEDYTGIMVSSVVFGYGMGGSIPLHGALVARLFQPEAFGRVMGLMRPMMLPVQLLGLPFAGFAYDAWGSYLPAFSSFLIVYLIAFGIIHRLTTVDHETDRCSV